MSVGLAPDVPQFVRTETEPLPLRVANKMPSPTKQPQTLNFPTADVLLALYELNGVATAEEIERRSGHTHSGGLPALHRRWLVSPPIGRWDREWTLTDKGRVAAEHEADRLGRKYLKIVPTSPALILTRTSYIG